MADMKATGQKPDIEDDPSHCQLCYQRYHAALAKLQPPTKLACGCDTHQFGCLSRPYDITENPA